MNRSVENPKTQVNNQNEEDVWTRGISNLTLHVDCNLENCEDPWNSLEYEGAPEAEDAGPEYKELWLISHVDTPGYKLNHVDDELYPEAEEQGKSEVDLITTSDESLPKPADWEYLFACGIQ